MRAHREPKMYLRGDTWWCYFRDERWSTKVSDDREAARIVRERYNPHRATSSEKGVGDAIRLLYDALDRRGRTQATKSNARQKLGHYGRLWGLDRSLQTIDWEVLSEYIRIRLDEDRVSRVTVSAEVGYLRQAWKLARAQGWVDKGWDQLMPERFDRKYVPRTRWLSAQELRAVMASLPDPKAAWVAWVVATGSDVSDVARAEPGDLDWKQKLVRVRGTKTVFRDRYVPITPITEALLRFAEQHGPPFASWPWVNGELRRAARLLGIPHFSPKDLRRTHGQWLRSAGVEPHLIGRVLGHADSAMADRVYAQGDERDIARLVRDAMQRSKPSARRRRAAKR
jgi:integrase